MFVLFAQVFVFYYGMFCDCLTSRQVILSLKIKKLLYVMQTSEDAIYQFVACKNRVLFASNSDNQRIVECSYSKLAIVRTVTFTSTPSILP